MVNGTSDVILVDFVCEALNDMLEKIEKLKESKKLSQESSFYNFKVKKGWTSFLSDHHNTVQAIFNAFISKFANNRQNSMVIYKFSDYSRHFISFLNRFLSKFPISRTNLQLRSNTNPRISGIVFEISNEKHDHSNTSYYNKVFWF